MFIRAEDYNNSIGIQFNTINYIQKKKGKLVIAAIKVISQYK